MATGGHAQTVVVNNWNQVTKSCHRRFAVKDHEIRFLDSELIFWMKKWGVYDKGGDDSVTTGIMHSLTNKVGEDPTVYVYPVPLQVKCDTMTCYKVKNPKWNPQSPPQVPRLVDSSEEIRTAVDAMRRGTFQEMFSWERKNVKRSRSVE